jgi:hypothetical protein
MKKLSIFFFIWLMLVSYSCDDSTTNSYFATSLIPFKLNNSWESVHFLYDSSGIPFYADTHVTQIVKDTVISGTRFYKYGKYSIDHYTAKADGIWLYEFHLDSTEEHSLYFKYPCKKGDTYPFTLGRPHAVVSILSTNQSVQVEAGTFECILYRFDLDGLDSYLDFYAAPGIGIVKAESYQSRRSGGTIYKNSEERLLSYHLN